MDTHVYVQFILDEDGEGFGFVGDSLGLNVCFECVWFEFGFICATGDGAFKEVKVHVGPKFELLEFVNLGLYYWEVL